MRARSLVLPLLFVAAAGALAVACTSILGVEDLHQGPNPNAGGQGQGGSGTGGGAGSGTGGASSAGSSGTGGSAQSGAVNGTVIDFFGHKVPNATVAIGTATVSTDAQGKFTVPGVPAQYDVSLIVNPDAATFGWVYQGLTRRDPTLQVIYGITEQSGNAHITIANGPPADTSGYFDTSTTTTAIAFGSPDGSYNNTLDSTDSSLYVNWFGPATTQTKAHALWWNIDTNSMPTAYHGFTELPVALDNSTTAQVPISFPTAAVSTASISGTVTPKTSTLRANLVCIRFADGSVIPLLDQSPGPDSFSYTVPSVANSVITVAAAEGDTTSGPFAVAHKDVAAGQTNISLAVPTAPTLVAPADAATNVGPNTTFRWTGVSGVVLLYINDYNGHGVFVLTSATSATLPLFDGTSLLPAGVQYYWGVEKHLDWLTVDSATGPTGFEDAFGRDITSPSGSRLGDGTYAFSVGRTLTTAP